MILVCDGISDEKVGIDGGLTIVAMVNGRYGVLMSSCSPQTVSLEANSHLNHLDPSCSGLGKLGVFRYGRSRTLLFLLRDAF